MSEVGNVYGGRIIPALRYRNGAAAIDWLCAAFGFERKMVVPADGGRVAHAELTLGNGMVMLGDAEIEYGRLVAAPSYGEPVTQGIYCRGRGCALRAGKSRGCRDRARHQDAGLWRPRLHGARS